MLSHLRPAITMTVLFTGLCGLAYPLAITGVAQAVLPAQANGSIVTKGDAVVGSALIGQAFTSPRYFASRPSATSNSPYNPLASGGTNLGATSQKLKDQIAAAVTAWQANGRSGPVPADAVTSSASGLDPDISPENARQQVALVAKARNMPEKDVAALVESQVQPRLLGVIGEPRVNVLRLNMALDAAGATQ
ncbi:MULTISPECIES: potassium-transporting ATPase subunit KdpC [Rhizobium/Agrobacterium group]|uniref:potassium-transporting ATPase subunit KdpC n=1 Tax=Rhizobium/Agrobacterium group TaxID=227290 RepID=UPI0012E7B395|nr:MULTISPECIES: potassium-transporting ATPase subunit KdpC [Rhizobium/Agrobacterium group]MCF1472604.1 potassium-transporting ATPase subunit KdpC [Allorhizobium ampelinum]MVA49804.1 potassium-transporting ATPase subunit KdpC [Agrobacterium vitis]NSZ54211.1 potassium-transporting ATPase subunit KdpC [Agrobacterium vitis]NTA34233.1 potassium-transporting ATPase subunit KdpC [Agrobacterium vitis]